MTSHIIAFLCINKICHVHTECSYSSNISPTLILSSQCYQKWPTCWTMLKRSLKCSRLVVNEIFSSFFHWAARQPLWTAANLILWWIRRLDGHLLVHESKFHGFILFGLGKPLVQGHIYEVGRERQSMGRKQEPRVRRNYRIYGAWGSDCAALELVVYFVEMFVGSRGSHTLCKQTVCLTTNWNQFLVCIQLLQHLCIWFLTRRLHLLMVSTLALKRNLYIFKIPTIIPWQYFPAGY